MTAYIATFHTHLSALLTCRALTAAGVAAQMMPVPRRLSAACGTVPSEAFSGKFSASVNSASAVDCIR